MCAPRWNDLFLAPLGAGSVRITFTGSCAAGRIEFIDVDFTYPSERQKQVLHKLSFTVEPRTKVRAPSRFARTSLSPMAQDSKLAPWEMTLAIRLKRPKVPAF